jgi:ABC-type polysaccharide/polyol phosphate transport system ATPase subunit
VIAIRAENLTKAFRGALRRKSPGTLKSALLSRPSLSAAQGALPPALSGVSFKVARGETIGVIGENGSGKSTLLRLVAGILKPTSGRIETSGRVAALIELGAGFHPEITARENIEINAMLLGISRRDAARKLDSIVSFAGLEEYLDSPVRTFSSGMAVRLGFSIAAHVEPDILLVDEVLAVGDEAFTHRCVEKIGEFQKEGRTIVVVSHDLNLVLSLCPRVLRLSHGTLVADCPAAEAVGRYREDVAAGEGRARLTATESSESRWGSGAARLETVRLFGGRSEETRVLVSGEPMRIALEGEAREELSDFVAGVQISRTDGTVVFGSNTAIDGHECERLAGRFALSLEIDAAELGPGTYVLDAALHARDGAPYDYRRDVLRFEVYAPEKTAGVWRPRRKWVLTSAGRWKR